jgi:hypothetical protein
MLAPQPWLAPVSRIQRGRGHALRPEHDALDAAVPPVGGDAALGDVVIHAAIAQHAGARVRGPATSRRRRRRCHMQSLPRPSPRKTPTTLPWQRDRPTKALRKLITRTWLVAPRNGSKLVDANVRANNTNVRRPRSERSRPVCRLCYSHAAPKRRFSYAHRGIGSALALQGHRRARELALRIRARKVCVRLNETAELSRDSTGSKP